MGGTNKGGVFSLFFLAPKQIKEDAGRGAPAWPAVSVWSLNPQIVPGARRSWRHLSESHIGCRGGRRGGRENGAAPINECISESPMEKEVSPFWPARDMAAARRNSSSALFPSSPRSVLALFTQSVVHATRGSS